MFLYWHSKEAFSGFLRKSKIFVFLDRRHCSPANYKIQRGRQRHYIRYFLCKLFMVWHRWEQFVYKDSVMNVEHFSTVSLICILCSYPICILNSYSDFCSVLKPHKCSLYFEKSEIKHKINKILNSKLFLTFTSCSKENLLTISTSVGLHASMAKRYARQRTSTAHAQNPQ